MVDDLVVHLSEEGLACDEAPQVEVLDFEICLLFLIESYEFCYLACWHF